MFSIVATHTAPVLRFRRWCRKGYAVFCSLGRLVSIGQLSKSIADASMRKQTDPLQSYFDNDTHEDSPQKDPDEDSPGLLLAEWAVCTPRSEENAGAFCYNSDSSINREPIVMTVSRFFYISENDTNV